MHPSLLAFLTLSPLVHSQLSPHGDIHTSDLVLTSNTYSDLIIGTPSSTILITATFVSDSPADTTTATTASSPSSSGFLHPTPIGPGLQSLPSSETASTTTIGDHASTHPQTITVSNTLTPALNSGNIVVYTTSGGSGLVTLTSTVEQSSPTAVGGVTATISGTLTAVTTSGGGGGGGAGTSAAATSGTKGNGAVRGVGGVGWGMGGVVGLVGMGVVLG